MNTKHYWSILFLLSALLISLIISIFFVKTSIVEKGLVEGLVATPSIWFTSPYTQIISSTNLPIIISELQQKPELLDNPGTITGIINNPSIMNDPTIATAIANNLTYMKNTTIATNKYVSIAAEAIPLANPVKNVIPLSAINLQQQIATIQMTPSQLDIPGTITTILNNTAIMNDPTVASAIANNPTYIKNTIIIKYPSIVTALANNTTNPFNNTAKLQPADIQQKISAIQIAPTQLDIPGTITIILNNTSIMNDPTVTAAIVNNKTYMNNPIIVQYITSINPVAIKNSNTNNPVLNTKPLLGPAISNVITQIQSNPAVLDTPGTITTILNNQTIMDDPTVAASIIIRPTYMNNMMISTYPSIAIANANADTTSTASPATDNPASPSTDSLVSPSTDSLVSPATDSLVSPATASLASPSTASLASPSTSTDRLATLTPIELYKQKLLQNEMMKEQFTGLSDSTTRFLDKNKQKFTTYSNAYSNTILPPWNSYTK